MKKLLLMSVAGFMMVAPAAFASEDGEGQRRGGHHKSKMFQEADTNEDGVISKSEFKNHHEKKAAEWFDKLDSDGNGEVTKDESKAGRKKMAERFKERRENFKERRRGRASEE